MALTATYADTPARWWYQDGRRHAHMNVVESSYTASGSTPSASNFPDFVSVEKVIPLGLSDNGHVWRWDGSKIRANKADATEATVGTTDGRVLATEEFGNLKAGESADQATDSATAVTGGTASDVLALRTAADETVTAGGSITDPDYPRNIIVQLKASGGTGTLPTAGSVTVNFTDALGNSDSEVFDTSATTGDFGTGTIAVDNHRWKVGAKTVKTVTSIVCDVDGNEANLQYSVSLGTKLGMKLETDTETEATAIHRVIKNDADVAAATYVFDGTNNSVDLGADIAANDDAVIMYFVDQDVASGSATGSLKIDTEASGTDNVGTTLCLVIGTG